MSKGFYTIKFDDNGVSMLDQRLLPMKEEYHLYNDYKDVVKAIKEMVIRGAPAIGIAAAFGIALAAMKTDITDKKNFEMFFYEVLNEFSLSRPTAVNLFWAIKRMKNIYELNKEKGLKEIKRILKTEAIKIYDEDVEICKKIGEHGSILIKEGFNILTHCNAGALATSDFGTALSVIRAAHRQNKKINVYADETRPYLQGARLTAWELSKDGIPVTVICDNMAGYLMANGKINCVVVGADRIAANGDTANKIGTYSLAILAKYHNIPFYVAAPISTIDINISDGSQIPIEIRKDEEITHFRGERIVCEGVSVWNPSFDVTPATLITAIITEKGILKPDFSLSIKRAFGV